VGCATLISWTVKAGQTDLRKLKSERKFNGIAVSQLSAKGRFISLTIKYTTVNEMAFRNS